MSTIAKALSRAGMLAAGLTAMRASLAAAAGSRNGAQQALLSDRDKVAHLLRRAGFGFSQAMLDDFASRGLADAVHRLLSYDLADDSEVEKRIADAKLNLYNANDLQRSWLLRMIYTRRPLQEKMTLFWHGLLVSGTGKVGINQPRPDAPPDAPLPPHHMLNQIQYFRENALTDFGTMLKGISRDPAMVLYLDNNQNRRNAPNENYARELMELFSLGIFGPDGTPNYTESDVRESARAFTGWTLDRDQKFTLNTGQHDNNNKTIFGKTGNFNGDDVINLIMEHPSCAWYISKRLWEFFAYASPNLETLQPVINTFRATGGSVKEMLRTIFTHPAFYSEMAYRARAKSPVEYLAGLARALELETNATGFQSSAQRMGQTLYNPPNVAGWPGGAQWFNSTTWLERVNQLNRIITIRRDPNTQPVKLYDMLVRNKLDNPEKVVDHFLKLLVDGQVRPAQRDVLVRYLTDGNLWPRAGTSYRETDPIVDRKVRGLVYLIMAMPEFHLA